MTRILSGIQPSGKLHLGNYFGAIKQHLDFQKYGNCFYFIADYHALTTIHNPDDLRQHTIDAAMDYLALGLDPEITTFFKHSDVPEVTELAWMLNTVTPKSLLDRATSFKEKEEKGIEVNMGLFSYPILMAADILIYRSDIVPVGKDQVQHLELARAIAGKFNRRYGSVFPVPRERLSETAKVPGIDGQKMSKSYANTIEIFAEGKALEKRINSVITDCATVEDQKDPNQCNLLALLNLFLTPVEQETMKARYHAGGVGYGEVKKLLYERMMTYFADARERRKRLTPSHVKEILIVGGHKARAEAQTTIELVRRVVGL